jgi:hypothetical protein
MARAVLLGVAYATLVGLETGVIFLQCVHVNGSMAIETILIAVLMVDSVYVIPFGWENPNVVSVDGLL